MERIQLPHRLDWQAQVESLGFHYHSIQSDYWQEGHAWAFSEKEINVLAKAGEDVHAMCLDLVEDIVKRGNYAHLRMEKSDEIRAAQLIETSWKNKDTHLYGRFDFNLDNGVPKLLEYNADTPTTLLEAALIQRQWQEQAAHHFGQLNRLHENLVQRWQMILQQPLPATAPKDTLTNLIHFAVFKVSAEDTGNTEYIARTATEAGAITKVVDISEIHWNDATRQYEDAEGVVIIRLFKLYPWEWMNGDAAGDNLIHRTMQIVEPAWKLLLTNKSILPLLWNTYPSHPNLLPASFYEHHAKKWPKRVTKPIWGREGQNVSIIEGDTVLASVEGMYGKEGMIHQAYCQPYRWKDRCVSLGVWMIGDEASGLSIREDEGDITTNENYFVPHCIT